MSQQYDNTNRGILFINDRKEQDSHPDWKGSINIDGKEYWLSGWDKETSKGEAVSLSIKPKDAQQNAPRGGQRAQRQQRAPAPAPVPSGDASNGWPDDDDIPFAPLNLRAYW